MVPLKNDGLMQQVKKTLVYPVSLSRVSVLERREINNLKENAHYLVFQRYFWRPDLMPVTKTV